MTKVASDIFVGFPNFLVLLFVSVNELKESINYSVFITAGYFLK